MSVDPTRVSMRIAGFVLDLLAHAGVDAQKECSKLASFTAPTPPETIHWDDYITLIELLARTTGGAAGIAKTMRATLDTAYSDLRGLAGFFAGPAACYEFVTLRLMSELVPGVKATIRGDVARGTLRTHYVLDDSLRASRSYFDGTVTLTELFPCHYDLPEAKVEVVSIDERSCALLIQMPQSTPKMPWGRNLEHDDAVDTSQLTLREQEVLSHLCKGMTNAEIATQLGTSPSTVRNQISSILGKMDAVNRTELAARMAGSRPR